MDFLIENRDDLKIKPYCHLAIDKRPEEELFDIRKDPACIHNLAADPEYKKVSQRLWKRLAAELSKTGDPRMEGSDVFESYRRYSSLRYCPIPDWAKTGEVPTPNWVERR